MLLNTRQIKTDINVYFRSKNADISKIKMYHHRQLAMLTSAILTQQSAWAAAITELGGFTYLLVENQVKRKRLIESILLSDRNNEESLGIGYDQAILTIGGNIL